MLPYGAYRYSRWDGTQNILDMDAEELMDHLANELLNHGDMAKALRELMRQGLQDRQGRQMPGLKELMEQLKNRRSQQLQQYNMDSVMDEINERVAEILETEWGGIPKRLNEARQQVNDAEGPERVQMEALSKLLEQRAQRNLERLDKLPGGSGGVIRELMEYDFMGAPRSA